MKKLYFTATLLVLLAATSKAQYYTQYFDGADTAFDNSVNIELDPSTSNIWQIGKPQKIIFDSAATFPNAIVTDTINNYPGNNISIFTTKTYNSFLSWGVLAFQWQQKLDMEMDFDGGIVEFSIDSGVTWQNAFNNPYVYNFYGFQTSNLDTLNSGEFVFSGTDSSWRDIWLCFDLSWMNFNPDTLRFRFTFKSASSGNNKEGWMIDNMIAHHTFIHTVKEKLEAQTKYLNVYPNPAGNIVHIEAEKRMEFHIIEQMELIDPTGKMVEKWTNIPTKFWFDTGKYSPGQYLLNIKTNIRSESIPLLISKH